MPATKTTRFDHSNCKHARTGAEGKKARAACRKAHEAGNKTVAKKPTATKSTATKTTPRKRAVKKTPVTVAAPPEETVAVDELDDSDI